MNAVQLLCSLALILVASFRRNQSSRSRNRSIQMKVQSVFMNAGNTVKKLLFLLVSRA